MFDILINFYKTISLIDLFYLIVTALSVVKCYRKGFVLSLLAASKWLLAYIVTLILFPKIKPFFKVEYSSFLSNISSITAKPA